MVVKDEARVAIQDMLNDLERLVVVKQVSTTVQYEGHYIIQVYIGVPFKW